MTETRVPYQPDDQPQAASPLAAAISQLVNSGFIINIASSANPLRHHLMVYRSGGDTAYNKLTSDIEGALLELAGVGSETGQRRGG
jgi:hypothetical protein